MSNYPSMPAPQPMRDLNMTPLIDVLLVLLILFLISLPVVTNKVPVELPVTGRAEPGPPPPTHRLDITPQGALFWDGEAIAQAALPNRLSAMASDPASPRLHIAADGEARYEQVDEILADVARAEVTRIGFIGNYAVADF